MTEAAFRLTPDGPLYALFTRFQPEQNEILVGLQSPWFALTNLRLIQKDGASGDFKEVKLADIASFDLANTKSGTLVFHLKSGETLTFEKVASCPKDSYVEVLIQQPITS
jgi:hypothetical protein